MATHNLLLRLGDAMFLEVIAPNPVVHAPVRPRRFALVSLTPGSLPRLSAWVIRTPDINACVAAAAESLGTIVPMCRDELTWHITIPSDGSVPLDGAVPALIQWQTDVHPPPHLKIKACTLPGSRSFIWIQTASPGSYCPCISTHRLLFLRHRPPCQRVWSHISIHRRGFGSFDRETCFAVCEASPLSNSE